MKYKLLKSSVFITLVFLFISCANSPGKKVKEPFSGSKYQSNNKYFRGTGNGESRNQSIAKNKAMTNAKTNVAGLVKSRMKRLADVYLAETGNTEASELSEKFQTLSRELVNQDIADVRVIGDETFVMDSGNYKTYIALEIKKKSMYKWLKKLSKLESAKADAKTVKEYQKMLDKEIERLEAIEAEDE